MDFLVIYSRPGCHLCEEMKDIVARVALSTPISLEEIDISADAALEAQYGLEIPVLLLGGKKVAKYRIAEDDLRRLLLARREREGSGRQPR